AQVRWCIGDDNFFNKPVGEKTAWQECYILITKHDVILCQVWREEIDTLLVFAGLFSGVLTAFIIEAYKWLMEEPDDLTADYLRQILAVLSNNVVSMVGPLSERPSLPNNIISLLNGLWFSSFLYLSLTSALVGIVCKQWLREYQRDIGRSYKTNLAVRQVRYDGLKDWYVGAIVTTIPLLLQGALFLFLVGIVYLLWHIQPVIAAMISAFGLVIVLFFAITTVLPAAQFICYRLGFLRLHATSQVPYKSAQSLLFLRVTFLVINSVAWLCHVFSMLKEHQSGRLFKAPYRSYPGWPQWDLDWTRLRDESARWCDQPSSIGLCLGFMELNFEHQHLRDWIWNCLWGMRNSAVDAKYVLRCARRTPKAESEFPATQDVLAKVVMPLLDPRQESQNTSELVSLSLLDSKNEACVEHVIRVYNGLVRRGINDIPPVVYHYLRDTICRIRDDCSNETRTQLFLVAQNILEGSDHTEKNFSMPLELISTIVGYLCDREVQGMQSYIVADLSLDIADVITDWLDRYPEPSANWREYKSRVLWAARAALLLVRRLSRFKALENIPADHPRLGPVYALVALADAGLDIIPKAVLPTWSPDNFDPQEFRAAKASLEAIIEASPEPDIGRRHDPGAQLRRTPSNGSSMSSAREPAVCSWETIRLARI
ncbi:hypothetical protein HDZ31DRAFT_42339, partial [Schizophyllum fasciatum]